MALILGEVENAPKTFGRISIFIFSFNLLVDLPKLTGWFVNIKKPEMYSCLFCSKALDI